MRFVFVLIFAFFLVIGFIVVVAAVFGILINGVPDGIGVNISCAVIQQFEDKTCNEQGDDGNDCQGEAEDVYKGAEK